ncbi:MAG TPA: hypothetical protein VIZ28_12110 [Chitinophagaceae bacterium]
MSTSNKRSLIFIIIFLLLTNIGVLGYFLWFKKPPSKPSSGPPVGMAKSLQNEVGFDSLQIIEYRKIKEKHWATIKPMFEDIRKTKDSLFRLLSYENVNDSLVNATADAIGQKQKAIDLQAFNNFKQIRALCKPEQLVKYDSLVQRMVRKMGRPQRGGDQSKKDKK